GSGVEFDFPFQGSTTYSLSMWLRRDTSSATNFSIGRNDNPATDGTTTGDTNCTTTPSTITVDTTWRQYTCTFTTGTTIGQYSNFYLKLSSAAASNVFIDGVTLVAGSTPLTYTTPGSALQVDAYSNVFTINSGNNAEIQPWQEARP